MKNNKKGTYKHNNYLADKPHFLHEHRLQIRGRILKSI